MKNLSVVKNTVKASVLSLALFGSSAFAAGVPVIDPAAIAQAVTQVQNQVQQMQNQVKQFESMNGSGVLGQLLNDPTTRRLLNQHLPNGYTDVMDAVRNNDLGALQSVYQGVMANEQSTRQSMTGKERLASTMMVSKAQTQAMMQSLNVRSNNIQALANRINSAVDSKTKADLANRLSAEQSMIGVEMNKMQVAMKINEQNEALARRQEMKETRSKLLSN